MPDSKFSTIYIPRQTRVILDQVQAKYHPDLPLGQIVHRAMAIYNRKAEYRDEAATLSTEEPVLARDGARKVKIPRATKKVKSAPAKEQKAQASPPASQSNGIVRRQVVGVQAPGRSRPPVRPVAPKEPEPEIEAEPAEDLPQGAKIDDDGRIMMFGASDD